MRRALLVLTMALLAGCGAGEREAAGPHAAYGPVRAGHGTPPRPLAPPRRPPEAEVARALAAGVVGVMGVEGRVGVRPRTLEVSGDGTLERLRWTAWGDGSAAGSGRLRLRDCDPSCASGGTRSLPATVRLSAPRLCGRATYFDRAEVAVDGAPPPATYVRAPC